MSAETKVGGKSRVVEGERAARDENGRKRGRAEGAPRLFREARLAAGRGGGRCWRSWCLGLIPGPSRPGAGGGVGGKGCVCVGGGGYVVKEGRARRGEGGGARLVGCRGARAGCVCLCGAAGRMSRQRIRQRQRKRFIAFELRVTQPKGECRAVSARLGVRPCAACACAPVGVHRGVGARARASAGSGRRGRPC